jgi:hypothetical protein
MSIVRVTLSQVLYGQTMQNVMHFDDNVSDYVPEQIMQDIINHWIGVARFFQCANLTYRLIQVANLTSPTLPEFSQPLAINGGNFQDVTIVPFAALVLQIRTALAGRHGRGRIYIAGFSTSSDYENGLVKAQWYANNHNNLAALNADFCTDATTNTSLRLVVRDRPHHLDHPAVGLVARATLGAQRKRNINVGI